MVMMVGCKHHFKLKTIIIDFLYVRFRLAQLLEFQFALLIPREKCITVSALDSNSYIFES